MKSRKFKVIKAFLGFYVNDTIEINQNGDTAVSDKGISISPVSVDELENHPEFFEEIPERISINYESIIQHKDSCRYMVCRGDEKKIELSDFKGFEKLLNGECLTFEDIYNKIPNYIDTDEDFSDALYDALALFIEYSFNKSNHEKN